MDYTGSTGTVCVGTFLVSAISDRGALGLAAALCGTITRLSEQISASHREWDALGWIALVSKRKSFQKNQPFPMLCGICPISMIIMGFQRKLKSGHEDSSADCGGRQ